MMIGPWWPLRRCHQVFSLALRSSRRPSVHQLRAAHFEFHLGRLRFQALPHVLSSTPAASPLHCDAGFSWYSNMEHGGTQHVSKPNRWTVYGPANIQERSGGDLESSANKHIESHLIFQPGSWGTLHVLGRRLGDRPKRVKQIMYSETNPDMAIITFICLSSASGKLTWRLKVNTFVLYR